MIALAVNNSTLFGVALAVFILCAVIWLVRTVLNK